MYPVREGHWIIFTYPESQQSTDVLGALKKNKHTTTNKKQSIWEAGNWTEWGFLTTFEVDL